MKQYIHDKDQKIQELSKKSRLLLEKGPAYEFKLQVKNETIYS